MRNWSPEAKHFGGLKPMPTPTGVPVAITSPGYRVATEKSVSQFASLGAELAWDRGSAVERPYSYTTLSHGLSGTYFMTSLASRLQL
ncbi:MAG: hypothetical protein ACI9LD_000342, partial [Polaromonas sp.]